MIRNFVYVLIFAFLVQCATGVCVWGMWWCTFTFTCSSKIKTARRRNSGFVPALMNKEGIQKGASHLQACVCTCAQVVQRSETSASVRWLLVRMLAGEFSCLPACTSRQGSMHIFAFCQNIGEKHVFNEHSCIKYLLH